MIFISNKFYWLVGKFINDHYYSCENIFDKCSTYLSYYFGNSNYDRVYLRKMYMFYNTFPIYTSILNKLSWNQYLLLFDINDKIERYFYFKLSLFCKSNYYELNKLINIDVYSLFNN